LPLTSYFISAQQSSQLPSENRAAPDKEVMVVRKGIRIDRTQDTLPTRHPVIQIELHSERLFDGRNQIHSLRIGSHEFTRLNGTVFELTPREFARTKTGDEVVVRYGATNPIKKRLLRDWHFGRLDKTEVDRRPVKTFEGTSIGDTPSYSKDGKLIHAGPPIRIRSRTRDTRTNVPIISVTDENMFPQRWLSSPIEARATRLSKKELKRSIYILDVAMSKYPILLLRENIKAIYLLNSLTLYGIAADASNSADSIYIVNTGDKEYTDGYLESSFHRAFENLMLQKNNKGRDSGRWDMARFAPRKTAWEVPSADHLMKLVYHSDEDGPEYIYALENTGFVGLILLKQFKQSPADSAIRCLLRCQQTNPTPPVPLQLAIKEHGFVYHKTVSEDAPVWSNDGKQIAFRSTRDSDSVELYVMQVNGSNLRRLTHTPLTLSRSMVAAACWSPDDRQLAYVLHDAGGSKLFTVNADGTGQRRLSVESVDRLVGWLRDGRILVVTESFDRSRSVYSILPDGTGLTRFTEGANLVAEAFLAPDQNLIAIKSFDNLIIKDLESNTLSQSMNSSGREVSWSPDSKQIAYQDQRSLTVRDLRSGATRSSSIDSNEAVFGISWSPDGKQIAYVGARNLSLNSPSVNELRVVNADGTGVRRLTAEGFAAVWSPDGRYIIFSRLQARIYLIRPDGSGERYLASGAYAKWIP
jgi:Tol biopolymer transport system component